MDEMRHNIGRCGFYCGSCPDFTQGKCPGCRETPHQNCYTFDCVDRRGLEFCGQCGDFPCQAIITRPKATVLDKDWLRWKARVRDGTEK